MNEYFGTEQSSRFAQGGPHVGAANGDYHSTQKIVLIDKGNDFCEGIGLWRCLGSSGGCQCIRLHGKGASGRHQTLQTGLMSVRRHKCMGNSQKERKKAPLHGAVMNFRLRGSVQLRNRIPRYLLNHDQIPILNSRKRLDCMAVFRCTHTTSDQKAHFYLESRSYTSSVLHASFPNTEFALARSACDQRLANASGLISKCLIWRIEVSFVLDMENECRWAIPKILQAKRKSSLGPFHHMSNEILWSSSNTGNIVHIVCARKPCL